VPIAGKYRLIDIPVSNCIHSGLHRIFVVTQFNSVSLHRHIYNTYKFDPFEGGFVEILAAQQTMLSEDWYQGTADAVRQNIPYFTDKSYDLVVILSGDQLYRMNFQEMIKTHLDNKAAVTIAALPVAEAEARSCGIMRIQADGRVIDFEEKPKTQEKLNRVRTETSWLEKLGLKAQGRPYLASMGIYVFNTKTLVDLLGSSSATDFGHELLPQTIASDRVQAHLFDGYWEDIGTIGAFHQANIDLTRDHPSFNFTQGEQPIFTRPRYLPCTQIQGATVRNSLISDGCVIGRGAVIENSVIGVRSIIGDGVTIRDSYLMGVDWYEQPDDLRRNQAEGIVNLGVGAGSVIERAIVDKGARIGKNVRVVNEKGVEDDQHEPEAPTHVIRDKVVVIPKQAVLREGTVI
jgi:glucose-1-phosphate adenylyltransferase